MEWRRPGAQIAASLLAGLAALVLGPILAGPQAGAAPLPQATVTPSASPSASPATASPSPGATTTEEAADDPVDDGLNTTPSNDGFVWAVGVAGVSSVLAGVFVAVRR